MREKMPTFSGVYLFIYQTIPDSVAMSWLPLPVCVCTNLITEVSITNSHILINRNIKFLCLHIFHFLVLACFTQGTLHHNNATMISDIYSQKYYFTTWSYRGVANILLINYENMTLHSKVSSVGNNSSVSCNAISPVSSVCPALIYPSSRGQTNTMFPSNIQPWVYIQ